MRQGRRRPAEGAQGAGSAAVEAGIKAELVHAAAPSQTFQYEWAAARNIHWLVIIHAVTFSTTDTVQVRIPISLLAPCWPSGAKMARNCIAKIAADNAP